MLDARGFDYADGSATDILMDIEQWLLENTTKSTKLDGLIYLHRITNRQPAQLCMRSLMHLKKLCGNQYREKMVLATTMLGHPGLR
jgi:hypothetical protein